MKKKVTYIYIINAIAIIAVLIGHLDITGKNNDPNTPIANVISDFGSFQMPLFFCVSGLLFYMTSGYNKSFKDLLLSKVKRLIIPFLFLSLFTFCYKLCLPSKMLVHEVSFTFSYLFKLLFVPFRGPAPHLWFVVSLFTMFAISPLLKRTLKTSKTTVVSIVVLAVLTAPPLNTEILALNKTLNHLIWFYIGILMGKDSFSQRLSSLKILIVSAIAYIFLRFFVDIPYGGNLITLAFGLIFIFSLAQKLAEYLPNIFSCWRNYTYQIYLLHMYPITLWKFIYKKHFIANEDIWFALVWMGSLACAIILPAFVAKIVEKTSNSKIKALIGL